MLHIIIFLFLCLVWGTTWIAIKYTLLGLPPFFSAGIRFLIATVLLTIFLFSRRTKFKIKRTEVRWLFYSAMLMYIFDYGLIYWGEQYLSAGVTAIYFATFPLFTGVFSVLFFKSEKLNWQTLLGLPLGFIGVMIVFFDQLQSTNFDTMVILASLAIIVGAAGGALSVVITKKYLTKMNSSLLTFYQMFMGGIILILMSGIFETYGAINYSAPVVYSLLYLSFIGSALAFALYYYLLQNVTPITLSLIIYITPIIALYVDYILVDEIIKFRAVLGMLVIFSGIVLTQLKQFKFQKK